MPTLPDLSGSLQDTDRISRSPIRVTKPPRHFEEKYFNKILVFMLILTDFTKKIEIFDTFKLQFLLHFKWWLRT